MATLLTNSHPKDNPLSIKIHLDTVINNVSLNPSETYDVSIKPLNVSDKTLNLSLYQSVFTTTNPYIKLIKLYSVNTSTNYWLKVYLPFFDNGTTIYLVPSISDVTYDTTVSGIGTRDLTAISDLSTTFTSAYNVKTWSMSLEYWIMNTLGFFNYNSATDTRPFPSKTTTLSKVINLSVKGLDTNRADENKLANVTLTSLMKTFGS